MKSKLAFVAIAAAVLSAVAPCTAFARGDRSLTTEYVLNVPVKISGLGPGHTARVLCALRKPGPLSGNRPGMDYDTITNQRVPVPLDPIGNYAGTIVVKFALATDVTPTTYWCALEFDQGQIPLHKSKPKLMVNGTL